MFRGRGGVFRNPEQRQGENPLKLVQVAARAYPAYFAPALAQIEALATSEIHRIFSALPVQRASPMAQAFA
jgi:hypothetical protein